MIITSIFPLDDQQVVIVHLASFEWDFTLGKLVKLTQSDTVIPAIQIGSGNHERHATLVLAPTVEWQQASAALREMRAMRQPV